MGPTLEDRLRQLEDKEEIRDLLNEYGRTLDRRDLAAYSRLFAADGEWEGALHGHAPGQAGRSAVLHRTPSIDYGVVMEGEMTS